LNSINNDQSISIDFALTAVAKSSTVIFAINDERVMKEKKTTKKKKKHLLLTKEEDIKLLQLCLQNANSYEASKMMTA
jgi:hypothetical protein